MEGLPDTLVVIPLDAKVLLPSIHTKFELKGHHSTSLVRKHIQLKEGPAYIACIPLLSDKTLFRYGCTARVTKLGKSNNGFMLNVQGIQRFKVNEFGKQSPLLVQVEHISDAVDMRSDEVIAFSALARTYVSKFKLKPMNNMSLSTQADAIVDMMETSFDEKLSILAMMDTKERIVKATGWMTRQLHVNHIYIYIYIMARNNLPIGTFHFRTNQSKHSRQTQPKATRILSFAPNGDDQQGIERSIQRGERIGGASTPHRHVAGGGRDGG
jgi:ATP-dependent Lon protease